MKNQLLQCFLLLALLSISCGVDQSIDPNQEEWEVLFNGANMEGWTAKFTGSPLGENVNDIFVVEDSILKVSYTKQDSFDQRFGHLFFEKPFSYYKIRATYRFIGDQLKGGPGWAFRNNGLMLHCQEPSSMALDQDFPNSLELQLLGGDGENDRPNANLCTPGLHVIMGDSLHQAHCTNSSSATYHGDDWVSVEGLVLGDSLIQHFMDGEVVLEYSKPIIESDSEDGRFKAGDAVTEGYIAIQAETHPTQFKSIEVLNLCGCMDEKAKNYKSYYIKSDPNSCKY
jgi:hypothetical protein